MNKYDPMTGKLLEEEKIVKGYDPMTGKPIYEQNDESNKEDSANRKIKSFDPMTGEPIYEGAVNVGKNGNSKLFILAGGMALIVILVFAIISSGAFLSKSDKILSAFSNTLKEQSQMVEALKNIKILKSDSYTIDLSADMDELFLEAQYSKKASNKQISGNVQVERSNELEFLAGITNEEVKLQLPDMSDYIFTYNYKNEKEGFIADALDNEEIEAIDKACAILYSEKTSKDIIKAITDIAIDNFEALEFKSLSKKQFKINGKDRNCSGYKTTISGDDIEQLIKDVETYIETEYDSIYDAVDLKEIFDELCDECKYINDTDFEFYIYNNKIACININSGSEVSVLFTGSKKGMHNITVEYGRRDMELEGSVNNSRETYTLYDDGKEVLSIEYDYKSGDFELISGRESVEGNLKSSKKEFNLMIDEYSYNGNSKDLNLEMNVKKGALLKEYDGEEFDLGSASRNDLMDVYDEINGEYSLYDAQEVSTQAAVEDTATEEAVAEEDY